MAKQTLMEMINDAAKTGTRNSAWLKLVPDQTVEVQVTAQALARQVAFVGGKSVDPEKAPTWADRQTRIAFEVLVMDGGLPVISKCLELPTLIAERIANLAETGDEVVKVSRYLDGFKTRYEVALVGKLSPEGISAKRDMRRLNLRKLYGIEEAKAEAVAE